MASSNGNGTGYSATDLLVALMSDVRTLQRLQQSTLEAQRETAGTLAKMVGTIEALIEAQRRIEAKITEHEDRLDALERQRH